MKNLYDDVNFYELYSLSLVRLIKRSTFGLPLRKSGQTAVRGPALSADRHNKIYRFVVPSFK